MRTIFRGSWRFSPCSLVGVILAGCGFTQDLFTVDPHTTRPEDRKAFFRDVDIHPINLDRKPYCQLVARAMGAEASAECRKAEVDKLQGLGVYTDPSGISREEARNLLMDLVRGRSDLVCDKHKSAIVAYNAGNNLGHSLIVTGLTTAGTILTGGISNVLSGAAAAVNASRSAVSKEIFQSYIAPAVVKKIGEGRQAFLDTIKPERAKPTESYSVIAGLNDMQRYHHLCSFYAGLVALTQDGEKVSFPSVEDRRKLIEKELTASQARMATLQAQVKKLDSRTDARAILLLRRQIRDEALIQRRLRARISSLGVRSR